MLTYQSTKILQLKYFTKLKKFYSKVPYEVPFQHEFTINEETIILEQLNRSTFEDLNRFRVSSIRAKKILAHRKKHGNFINLNQVLAVEGFSVKLLQGLCQSVLQPSTDTEKAASTRTKNFNFVIPELTPARIENMNLVVGVSLAPLSISWCGISVHDRNLFSWGTHLLKLSTDSRHYNEMQILNAAYDAHFQLPDADTFVLESSALPHGTKKTANVAVNHQKLQLTSMLLVLLNGMTANEEPRVVVQRSSLWCRLYGILIGSERVTAQSFVSNILDAQPGPYTAPKVPEDIRTLYNCSSPLERESMCSALLLTMSFLDVSVKPLPECLKLLRGRVKPTVQSNSSQ